MSFFPANAAISHGLVLAATTTTAAKSSAASSIPFLVIIAAFVAFYLLVLRPRTQRARQAQSQSRAIDVGDEVATSSGIIGRVVAISDERATLEISSGSTMEVVRSAIVRRLEPYQAGPSDAATDDDAAADQHRYDIGSPSSGTGEQPGPADGTSSLEAPEENA